MSFSAPWDETKPAGSRNLNLGDDDIREFKQQVRERADVDGYFPSADDGNTGYHRKVTLMMQASDPAQVASALILYAKTVGSYQEIFSRHENAALQQLTLNGKLWIAALTMAGLTTGDLLFYDGSILNRLAAGASGLFLKSQGVGVAPAYAAVSGSYTNGAFKNLKVTNTGSNHVITLTADEVLVDDGAGTVQRFTSVSMTADIEAAAGAGGLDTGPGAEAANTIYYVWVIAKTDGTKGLMLSASSSAPTMPSGYTYKALLSAVGNNNSSNFIGFNQYGRQYFFTTWGTLASGNVGASWTSIDTTPANMTTNPCFIPSALSTHGFGTLFMNSTSTYLTNDSSVAADQADAPNKFGGVLTNPQFLPWELDIITADTLYWTSNGAASKVYLHGFTLNKIG